MIRICLAGALALVLCGGGAWPSSGEVILTRSEIQQVLTHGPWPPEPERDASNAASGVPEAIALGESLFKDPRLSKDGAFACATCHRLDLEFTDGLDLGQGRVRLDRNTQSLWNLRGLRWYGWSGDTDNLWAQNLTPLLNPDEMGQTPNGLQSQLLGGPHRVTYEAVFGPISAEPSVRTAVNIAKALAAYLETLTTEKTSFDRFRDALARGDNKSAGTYPLEAQRGLKIFLGEGRCSFCHSGPRFTNGEFHDAGVPYFLASGEVDSGRFGGLQSLAASDFTLDGDYTDDPEKSGAWAVRNVRFNHADFGTFRVPTLRRVARTAPYMHDGSLADLNAVLRHYNEIDMERLHSDGEALLRPIGLDEAEIADLLFFLETLSDDGI